MPMKSLPTNVIIGYMPVLLQTVGGTCVRPSTVSSAGSRQAFRHTLNREDSLQEYNLVMFRIVCISVKPEGWRYTVN
jgi:hypothetical protein